MDEAGLHGMGGKFDLNNLVYIHRGKNQFRSGVQMSPGFGFNTRLPQFI